LERLTGSFAEQTGIAAHLESRLPESRLPSETETVLYRVVQEALTNVVKHAGASRVSILVVRRGDAVAAVVEDDGSGFEPSTAREAGLGLAGMRERMALVDGALRVESSEGGGTTIAVEVPVR
ncbi:MAG TPA: ATP-binding protein, partial [Gaiella sp.]|uniref:sensor histidine kinase n=1 Tax=Gaiella sp. TaxID=2663207 RepID=UPI002D80C8DC